VADGKKNKKKHVKHIRIRLIGGCVNYRKTGVDIEAKNIVQARAPAHAQQQQQQQRQLNVLSDCDIS